MKYTFQKNKWLIVAIASGLTLLLSCSKSDEYKKYLEGGEIQYAGKLDSLSVRPGNNRVQLTGKLKADPSLKKIKISWNDGKDSVVFPIDMNTDQRKFSRTFPVEEGVRNFVVYTYDDEGHMSVATNAVGRIYGQRFQSGLSNRVLNTAVQFPAETVIDWLPIDMSAGPFATEVRYMSTTGQKTVRVPITAERNTLRDLAPGATTISYRTLYLPTALAIDTFTTDFVQTGLYKDVSAQYLPNNRVPFARIAGGDRWGNPANWITNDAVRNFKLNDAGTIFYGGIDNWFGGPQIAMEAGWSTNNMVTINNGKIYQSPMLPAGSYIFEMDIPDCTAGGDFYTVAARGDGIPNTQDIANSISYIKTNAPGTHKISFTLAQGSKVSLGFVGNLPNKGGSDGTFWRISQVRLRQRPALN